MQTAVTGIDPLFVDVYPGDGYKDWKAFIAAGLPWAGALFKASQGTWFRSDWTGATRQAFINAAGDRYGVTAFDGFYHYLDLSQDGAAQADYAMRAVERAGGEKIGTLWMMVDVERGGQRIQNPAKALVEDRTRAFAARYIELTGREATLYGGELLRSVGVTDRLGCARSALAIYGSTLPANIISRTGTDLEHTLFWQYQGTEAQTGPARYPRAAPGCGSKIDINAMITPGGLEAMRSQLWVEHP